MELSSSEISKDELEIAMQISEQVKQLQINGIKASRTFFDLSDFAKEAP